jgi:hypothetical protein
MRQLTKKPGVRLGVAFTLPQDDGDTYLDKVADLVTAQLALGTYLFVIGATGPDASGSGNPVVFVGSSPEFIDRASILTSAKFMERLKSLRVDGNRWHLHIKDLGTSLYDEEALWDILRKASADKLDPRVPPPGSKGIDQILADARAKLIRITPEQAYKEVQKPGPEAPVVLVDIRPIAQRHRDGEIPGALIFERNVLEWRFDPRCSARVPVADRYDLKIIVFCDEGYTSRYAVSLQIVKYVY